MRILLIEDNPGDARLIQEMLKDVKDLNYELTLVDRLATGLNHLGKENVDIILLDLNLPESQGLKTYEEVFSKAPKIPIVILTGLRDEIVAIQAIKKGAQDYLLKQDVNSHELARVIRYSIERNQAKENNNLLTDMIDLIPAAVTIHDFDGNFLYFNKKTLEIHGYTEDEFKTLNLHELEVSTTENLISQRMQEIKKLGELFFEASHFRKDRSIVPVSVNVKLTKWKNKDVLLSISTDITDRKQAEEELAKYRGHLEEMVKIRTSDLESFAYSVSHDLRAPLRAIEGFSQIIYEDYENQFDNEGKRLLKIIIDSTCKMDTLITDILALSQLGLKETALQTVNISALVEEVQNQVMANVTGRNIRWQIHKLPSVHGDRSLLRQVMVNLITNAVKFTRPQKKTIIEIGCQTEADGSTYYVKDNGVGFDKEYSEKLFEVFQRQHSDEEFEGTGIGLAIVQRIISRHHGRVWADGEVNKGAIFYFWLPNR